MTVPLVGSVVVSVVGSSSGGVADETSIGPGVAGFLVMFFLALAVVLLARSMAYHLRKVRYSPDPAKQDGGGADDERGADSSQDSSEGES
jgi:hypothetical protein